MVLPRQGFDFDRKPHRFRQRRSQSASAAALTSTDATPASATLSALNVGGHQRLLADAAPYASIGTV
jgi:hypothetical protein